MLHPAIFPDYFTIWIAINCQKPLKKLVFRPNKNFLKVMSGVIDEHKSQYIVNTVILDANAK